MTKNLYITLENGKTFWADYLADRILNKFPGIRNEADYKSLEDQYFDYTSACNEKEHQNWMAYYMNQAIKLDVEANRLRASGDRKSWSAAASMKKEAALQFIVAFDLM